MRILRGLWPWLAAILSGLLIGALFPPFNQSGLAWFALVPLTCALWFTPTRGRWRPLRLLGLGYVTGLVSFWISTFWLTEVTGAGWFVLSFYLAIYPALWALFAGLACRPRDPEPAKPGATLAARNPWLSSSGNLGRALRGAACWAALEWLRGTLFTGFGWNGLGVGLWKNVAVIQFAEFTGVVGVSFLVALVNLTLVLTARRLLYEAGTSRMRPHFDFTLTMALLGAAIAFGISRINGGKDDKHFLLSVAAVQANIPQDEKWDPEFEQRIIDTYARLTAAASAFKPDLLIWPEAATPRPLLENEDLRDEAVATVERLGTNFLLGSIRYVGDRAYNAAVLLDKRGGLQVYDKMHLVPFGEYIPLRHTFPVFAWIVGDLVASDFDAGTEAAVMTLYGKQFKVAPLICFEDTVGNLTRRFAAGGAELLVTLTNDGWFRESAGSEQHLANAVFRSAETKLPLVRAANTGVTCFIDRFGTVTRKLEQGGNTFIEGFLYGEVPIRLEPPKTFYTRHGDLFAIACVFATLLALRTILLTARREAGDPLGPAGRAGH